MRHLLLASLAWLLGTAAALADDFGPAGHLTDCQGDTDKTCAFERGVMAEQWPKALVGHYLSQRNIAWCLTDGCYGAVRVDPILACAWRIVILASGARELEKSDRDNYAVACQMTLSTEEHREAKRIAWDLFYAIYGRTPQ